MDKKETIKKAVTERWFYVVGGITFILLAIFNFAMGHYMQGVADVLMVTSYIFGIIAGYKKLNNDESGKRKLEISAILLMVAALVILIIVLSKTLHS